VSYDHDLAHINPTCALAVRAGPPDALADDQALAVAVRLGLRRGRGERALGGPGRRRGGPRPARPGRQLDPPAQRLGRRTLGGIAGRPAEPALDAGRGIDLGALLAEHGSALMNVEVQ